MGIHGFWGTVNEDFPELRHPVSSVEEVNSALGNLRPSQIIIDGCMILRLVWAFAKWGSRFAILEKEEVMKRIAEVATAMLLFVSTFLDPRVKWVWVFDGPNRKRPKARWKPWKTATNLNNGYRLLYLSMQHGAVGQGREKLDRNVYPNFFVIQGVASFINQKMMMRFNGSMARIVPDEADYMIGALCSAASVVVTYDGDIPVFTDAPAIIVPHTKWVHQ